MIVSDDVQALLVGIADEGIGQLKLTKVGFALLRLILVPVHLGARPVHLELLGHHAVPVADVADRPVALDAVTKLVGH